MNEAIEKLVEAQKQFLLCPLRRKRHLLDAVVDAEREVYALGGTVVDVFVAKQKAKQLQLTEMIVNDK